MRFSIKQKQVLGVTAMVALIVIALSLLHLVNTRRACCSRRAARASSCSANAVYHQARERRSPSRETAYHDAAHQPRVQSALEVGALLAGRHRRGHRRSDRHRDRARAIRRRSGKTVPRAAAAERRCIAMNGADAAARDLCDRRSTLEWTQPMALGDKPFGEIRIGLSTLLVRRDLNESLTPAAVAAGIALLVAVFVAMLLAQVVLRPMHVIRSSLSRLGRGELGATLDLRDDEEFRELGDVFDQVSAQLRAASPEGSSRRSSPSCRAASRWSAG